MFIKDYKIYSAINNVLSKLHIQIIVFIDIKKDEISYQGWIPTVVHWATSEYL